MKNYLKAFVGGMAVLTWYACNKPETETPDISGQLDRKYCNIPDAVNYNWNFPGIEDNTTCFFATSFYEGNWTFVDTVKRSDETVVRIDTLILNFQKPAADTSYRRMDMRGWCDPEILIIDVDRFYMARTDSFDGNLGWQKICNNRDSLMVEMRKSLFDSTKLAISITQFLDTAVYYHTGDASRM